MLKRWWQKSLALITLGVLLYTLINSAWFIKLFYPFPHQELIRKYCKEYQVDPYLVSAIIRTESSFSIKAQSRVGAKGLMQIMPDTGLWIAEQMRIKGFTQEHLYEPAYNIPMGIWYLAYLDKVFEGDLPKILAAYNAGERKVRKWLSDGTWSGRLQDLNKIPYPETREYVDKVLFDYQIYKKIYKST